MNYNTYKTWRWVWVLIGIKTFPKWLFDGVTLRTMMAQYGGCRVLTQVLSRGMEEFFTLYPLKPVVVGHLCLAHSPWVHDLNKCWCDGYV